MGIFAGPDAVENSLVLALDAGNTKSYPGSGTTWTNLSSRSNTGTFTNGPTYSSSDGGSIILDGVNDYVDFSSGFTTLDLKDKTLQCWIKKTGSSAKGIIDKDFDNGAPNYGGWGLWIQANNKLWWWNHANKDLLDDGSLSVTSGSWTNVAVTYNNTTKTAKFYINATLNSTKTDATIVEQSSSSAKLVVGSTRDGTASFCFDGNIAAVVAYPRVLSDSEIQQNFNALRGRFNI